MLLLVFVPVLLASPLSLTPDGKIKKTILRKGTGRTPTDKENVVIHYTGALANGTIFDSSRSKKPFQFTIGLGVISGWSIGVKSMRTGEIANFSIEYQYAYGERGYPPVIPPKSKLTFEIELLAIGE
jgi:FKBP-type peptidyl-prolyl cis-trans isomerase